VKAFLLGYDPGCINSVCSVPTPVSAVFGEDLSQQEQKIFGESAGNDTKSSHNSESRRKKLETFENVDSAFKNLRIFHSKIICNFDDFFFLVHFKKLNICSNLS